MEIHKKSLVAIMLIVSSLVALIGLFTFIKPQGPIENVRYSPKDSIDRIEDIPGVKDVRRFSDIKKNILNESKNKTVRTVRSVPVPTPTPLPYPRIVINYSIQRTTSIRNESAGANNTFMIVTLDIKNYGYIYFDAHPKRFKIVGKEELKPLVNISTGDMLDDIIPNNSRAKGDLIFKVSKNLFVPFMKIVYVNDGDNSYQILYRQVSQSVMEDKKEKKEEKKDEYES